MSLGMGPTHPSAVDSDLLTNPSINQPDFCTSLSLQVTMTLLLESNSYIKLHKIKDQISLSQYLSTKPSGLLRPFRITNCCCKYLNGKNYVLTLLPHTQVKKKKERNVYPDLKLSLI